MSDDEVERVITLTLESKPPDATHWSTRSMAKACGLSHSSVQRIWKAFALQPHRTETFKLSQDPLFVEKVRDIVGLYLNPPQRALVLSVDEKSQIQALDRSQPLLPMRPGQIERRTHDYKRHGTTSLFAALDVKTGRVIGQCQARILQAKEALFNKAKVKMVKRKACDSHPNPADADVADMLELFNKVDVGNKTDLPTYVSIGIDSMPSADFDCVAGVLCSLRDEISSLRYELIEVRKERERDIKVLEQSDNIMVELSEIKVLCKRTEDVVPSVFSNTVKQTLNRNLNVDKQVPSTSYRNSLSINDVPFNTKSPKAKPSKPKTNSVKINRTIDANKVNLQTNNTRKLINKKGTKVTTVNERHNFNGSKPVNYIYVGGCTKETTADGLKDFCEEQNVSVFDVHELNTRSSFYKSYKLSIDATHTNDVMNEEFWPQGIIFRRFFHSKNNSS